MRTQTQLLQRVMLATAAMGTRFEIVMHAEDLVRARAVGEAAIAEIERLHRQFSFYAPDSLLSYINRSAVDAPVRLDADTFALLCDALFVWRASGGAFDVTRGAGMDAVLLHAPARTIRLTRPGVNIDLGGIAKGHAVDNAAAILRDHGITSALVHGGTSSIVAIGVPAGEPRGWHVALAGTDRTVTLCDQTLSVSSGALRDHIIDPESGSFVTGSRIAAVIGPSARLGDAWSTALAVLGKRPAALDASWQTIIE